MVTVCGFNDSEMEVAGSHLNLHNKPFYMQTSNQCQLKPQYIKVILHYWNMQGNFQESVEEAKMTSYFLSCHL